MTYYFYHILQKKNNYYNCYKLFKQKQIIKYLFNKIINKNNLKNKN